MTDEINRDRRRFLGTAAMTLTAAAQLVVTRSAGAQSTQTKAPTVPTIKRGANTSFGELKQIDAGVLNVGYAEVGPTGGPPVVLLHGWPYDIHTYVDVAPLLASARYRVIVPYLRGYGTTRFLSSETRSKRSAIGVGLRHRRADGCARDRQGDCRRLRLGREDRQHRGRAVAGALQGDGLSERVSDRQPRSKQDAAAAKGGARVVVPVLLRDGTRARGLRKIPRRVCEAHLANRIAAMAF